MIASEWISVGSSFGAVSAALIALFTLLELAKQRKSTYKPDLCLLKQQFNITQGLMGKLGNLPISLDWVPPDTALPDVSYRASINIVNVGFGVAKKVRAQWKFNSKTVMETVNQMAQQTFQTFYLEEESVFLAIKSKGKNIYSTNNRMDCFKFEYLLPAESQPKGHEVYLPPSYMLLVSVYLFLCSQKKIPFSEIKVPSIQLELTYYDIGKECHNSIHNLECNINIMAEGSETVSASFGIEYIETA